MELNDYIAAKSTIEPEVLRELTRATHLSVTAPRMLSGAVQGRFLSLLVGLTKPQRVLELGTFTGYTAIAMGLAMQAGSELLTVDLDDETEALAQQFIDQAKLTPIVRQLRGRGALEVLPELGGAFDLVFIDANKREYLDYYNALFDNQLIKSGALIVADNTLWDGKVLDPTATDAQTQGVRAFNDAVVQDPRVEVVVLPLRDGISLLRVK